jgi:hypothetical protein
MNLELRLISMEFISELTFAIAYELFPRSDSDMLSGTENARSEDAIS